MINCIKRHVVCIILDAEGNVIGSGRNQCDPGFEHIVDFSKVDGTRRDVTCNRMHIKATEEGYDGTGCNSVHAEINAIASISDPNAPKPWNAIVMGHEFVCKNCMEALGNAGVSTVIIRLDMTHEVVEITPQFEN